MTRLAPLALALLVAASGCSRQEAAPAAPTAAAAPAVSAADAQFADLSARWLDGAMRLSPVFATQTGDHRFDAELDDYSAEGRAKLSSEPREGCALFAERNPRRAPPEKPPLILVWGNTTLDMPAHPGRWYAGWL